MQLRRPRSLNGLILVGLGMVAIPLLIAVVWTLLSLDRVTRQSEQLVATGASAAESIRRLEQQLDSLERVARQYQVLRNPESIQLMAQDLAALEELFHDLAPLLQRADALTLADTVGTNASGIVRAISDPDASDSQLQEAITGFVPIRERASELGARLSSFVDAELDDLQKTARRARQYSTWQVVALVPGTIFLVFAFSLLVARPIRQIDGAIRQLGAGTFARPISIKGPTDLEQLGQQLEWLRVRLLELAQEKNKFLRHMSHELKTPLANIREGTELLLDGSTGELDDTQREVADILRLNGLKLQQLIENLLSFSAWQTKSEVLNVSDFAILALVRSVAESQQLALRAADIQLKLNVDDIIVNADQDKIRTVLDNLLSNAAKFTPAGGTITVRAHAMGNGFRLQVGDTGSGVPKDERERIFDAFFQGRREQGGPVGGTGIGLSVVRECVQAHGGSVELIDSDEFSGACFRIEIPRQGSDRPRRLVANA